MVCTVDRCRSGHGSGSEKRSVMKASKSIFLLLTALLAAGLLSCGGASEPVSEKAPDAENEGASPAETEAVTEVDHTYDDALPELDFGGAAFIINSKSQDEASWVNTVMDTKTMNGDLINDAIFNRNRKLEERFNFVFDNPACEGDRTTYARKAIMAGSDEFDVFMMTDRDALSLSAEGVLIPYDEMEYMDFSRPYWSQSLNQALTIGGVRYFAYGDFNLSPYDYTHMLVFNKQLAAAYDLGSLYDLVLSGKWTYDAYEKLTKAVTHDVDGDGQMGENDCYGLLSQTKQVLPGFWIGAGVLSIEKNEADIPAFLLAEDEVFANVIDRIFSMTYDNDTYFRNSANRNDDTLCQTMFMDERGLFYDTTFKLITNLREMDADFGIMPYPKWNEEQESYRSRVEGGDFAIVPVTNTKLEMTGALLEAMSSESAKQLIPVYYEIALKTKTSRDAESEEMLEIIYRNRVYDLGDTYWCTLLRDGMFLTMFDKNDRELASKIAKNQSKVDKAISKIVDAFVNG